MFWATRAEHFQTVILVRRSVSSRTDERAKKKEAGKLEFEAWPSFNRFREWKMHFRSEVAKGSNRPTSAMPWINEMEKAKTSEDLSECYSITGAT